MYYYSLVYFRNSLCELIYLLLASSDMYVHTYTTYFICTSCMYFTSPEYYVPGEPDDAGTRAYIHMVYNGPVEPAHQSDHQPIKTTGLCDPPRDGPHQTTRHPTDDASASRGECKRGNNSLSGRPIFPVCRYRRIREYSLVSPSGMRRGWRSI